MPKALTAAIKSTNPKAQLTQRPTSRAQLLKANGSLHLSKLYLLLISLLNAINYKIKNVLPLLLDARADSSGLLMNGGAYIPMALYIDGFKNSPLIFAFHREAKLKIHPSDFEMQGKPKAGIDAGGKAPEAKVHS